MLVKNVISVVRTLALCALLIGCDSGVLWEDERYKVMWVDIGDNVILSYKLDSGDSIRRVPPRVVAIGSNEHYVVAQQMSLTTNETRYYYIDKRKDSAYYNGEDIAVGPLTEEEYNAFKVKLNLPEMIVL